MSRTEAVCLLAVAFFYAGMTAVYSAYSATADKPIGIGIASTLSLVFALFSARKWRQSYGH